MFPGDMIQTLENESVWPLLAAESLKALGGLGVLSFGGQVFLRRIFEVRLLGHGSKMTNSSKLFFLKWMKNIGCC